MKDSRYCLNMKWNLSIAVCFALIFMTGVTLAEDQAHDREGETGTEPAISNRVEAVANKGGRVTKTDPIDPQVRVRPSTGATNHPPALLLSKQSERPLPPRNLRIVAVED